MKIAEIIVIIILVIATLILAGMLYQLMQESTHCMINPLSYYENKTGVSCGCFKIPSP